MVITRLIVPVAALAFLAACGSAPVSWLTSNAESGSEQGANDAREGLPKDEHCTVIARQRADDARANGYDLKIENSVFAEAYRDCIEQHYGVAN